MLTKTNRPCDGRRGLFVARRQAAPGIALGFTLVEILAVVVILGIASAIIIPQIGSRDDMKTAAAARVIVADLIYAQNLAISSGSPVYVRFDTTNNQYTMLTNPLSTKTNFGDFVTNPVTQQNYLQKFGDVSAQTVDPWENVTIDTVALNGVDSGFSNEFTVGFDSIGSPYVWDYTSNLSDNLADGSKIIIKSRLISTTINIAAATGEITVQ